MGLFQQPSSSHVRASIRSAKTLRWWLEMQQHTSCWMFMSKTQSPSIDVAAVGGISVPQCCNASTSIICNFKQTVLLNLFCILNVIKFFKTGMCVSMNGLHDFTSDEMQNLCHRLLLDKQLYVWSSLIRWISNFSKPCVLFLYSILERHGTRNKSFDRSCTHKAWFDSLTTQHTTAKYPHSTHSGICELQQQYF